MRHTKKQGNMARSKEQNKTPETNPKETQIFTNHISHKKLIYRIYNELLEFDKKIKKLKKQAKDLDNSPKMIYDDQKVHAKILNITNY